MGPFVPYDFLFFVSGRAFWECSGHPIHLRTIDQKGCGFHLRWTVTQSCHRSSSWCYWGSCWWKYLLQSHNASRNLECPSINWTLISELTSCSTHVSRDSNWTDFMFHRSFFLARRSWPRVSITLSAKRTRSGLRLQIWSSSSVRPR